MGGTPFYQTWIELEHHFSKNQTNSNTLFLAWNDQTLNFGHITVFTTFTKILIELTRTSFFRTSNELESVFFVNLT